MLGFGPQQYIVGVGIGVTILHLSGSPLDELGVLSQRRSVLGGERQRNLLQGWSGVGVFFIVRMRRGSITAVSRAARSADAVSVVVEGATPSCSTASAVAFRNDAGSRIDVLTVA